MSRFFFGIIFFMFLPIQTLSLQSGGLQKEAKPSRVQLIEIGTFHGNEMQAKSGEHWLGLYKTGKSFALMDSVVRVKRVHDPVVDEDESKKTGKEVSVNHSSEPIFLVKGAPMLKAGLVTTVFAGEKDLLNNTNFSLKLANKDYHLKVIAKNRKANPWGIREDAKLILTQGKITQVLDVFGDETEAGEPYWGLYWAGDLDKDGKLDLYVDVRWHYNISQHKLFLSSLAGKGQLVKMLAQLETTGC